MSQITIPLLCLCLFYSFAPAFGQNNPIEQTTINGKTYLVYPHQIPVTDMADYYKGYVDKKEVIKRDELNEKIVSVTEVELTDLEKKLAQRFVKNSKKLTKELEQLFILDPFFLVSVMHGYDNDPTPSLSPLPDGEYVIFYRDIPYIKNRVLRYKNDIPAAFIQIQNNEIVGESTWYYPQGKLYMEGAYSGSEKDGDWKAYEYNQNYNEIENTKTNKSVEELYNELVYDTIITRISFKNGLRDGQFTVHNNQDLIRLGHYKMDGKTGLWETYAYKEEIVIDAKGRLIVKTTRDKYLCERYTLRTDGKRGKSIIIRDFVIPLDYYEYGMEGQDSLVLTNTYTSMGDSDEYYELGNFPNFSSFYDVLIEDTNDLDLLEEGINSYEGEEYGDEFLYEEEYFYERADYNPNERYESVNGKRYTINQLIDSIGYLFPYEGVVERYYSNGQLQYRFEIKDGTLVKEEPFYWDNGQIANEVIFVEDSNQYVQRYYDYNGTLYYESWYDKKGNAKSIDGDWRIGNIKIRGRSYEPNYGSSTFYYSSDKELLTDSLSDRVLVMEQLYKVDTSIASQTWYYPESKLLKTIDQNILHEDVRVEEVQFSDDFNNVNLLASSKYLNMELRTIQNGVINKYLLEGLSDTFNRKNFVYEWEYKYSGEGTNDLWVNDKLYTGSFKLVDNQSKLKVKANDKSIQVTLPTISTDIKLYHKTIKKYLKNGKRNKLLEGYTPNFGGSPFFTRTVLGMFPDLYQVFKRYNDYSDYRFDGELEEKQNKKKQKSKKISEYTSVEGQYLNGKPEGIWVYKDQNGKIRSVIAYKNGEPHGQNLYYRFAMPKEKPKVNKDPYAYQYEDPLEKYAQYPEKKTYYLETSQEFKNGILNGPYIKRNWKNDTLNFVNYVDGSKEGVEINRNVLLYSQSNYQNGLADGKIKTYLTIPGRDTILIFDLSLKNGTLQGESVAYHTNGKIAKKGFFLSGQPIDDYEAYDTLGNKYQYVKFLYNQPIEEKIWEENELSIRYEFDWRDSIPFYFGDITGSSSIERLLYEIGYRDNSFYQPYYGRPSLVNKTGIDYDITKYYPNDTIARTGLVSKGIKKGCWKYYNYEGKKTCEVEYFDSLITVNDSIKFKSKGIVYYLDEQDQVLSKSYIIEKFEKYDCSHTDHNEERMLYCFWEKDSTQHRKNGYVKNYYDNGALQNEGFVKDGLPTGVWKMYDVNGNLSQVGEYVMGKRNGRWLKGDLGTVKNMSEICLNPNLENIEAILSYQEKLLDVSVITYKMGKELKRRYFGINQNNEEAPQGYYEDGYYPEGY